LWFLDDDSSYEEDLDEEENNISTGKPGKVRCPLPTCNDKKP
jgi:hypothetical protein